MVEAGTCHSTFPDVLLVFFCRMVLTQNPAQANNFIFPAMASPRQVIFLILVRIRLPAHERTSGRSQSGGSHNSELDRLANRAQVGPAASEHLPQAVASVWDSYLTDSNCQCWYLVWHSSWSCTAGLVNLKASQIFLQVSCAGARLRARVWSRCRSAAASAGHRL